MEIMVRNGTTVYPDELITEKCFTAWEPPVGGEAYLSDNPHLKLKRSQEGSEPQFFVDQRFAEPNPHVYNRMLVYEVKDMTAIFMAYTWRKFGEAGRTGKIKLVLSADDSLPFITIRGNYGALLFNGRASVSVEGDIPVVIQEMFPAKRKTKGKHNIMLRG